MLTGPEVEEVRMAWIQVVLSEDKYEPLKPRTLDQVGSRSCSKR